MKEIKVKAPAKINLTLEIINKREDGFHNLKTIMHAISLYDILAFRSDVSDSIAINLYGNSDEIPYNEKNLVYKAAMAFFNKANIKGARLDVYIEKNIPLEAGMGGGSSDAAATLVALNKLYENILTDNEIDELAASLGSDINFCIKGGCAVCTSRGEVISQISPVELPVSIIKPKNFGISTKEAYSKYGELKDKTIPNATEKLSALIKNGKFDEKLLFNSFEKAYLNDYKELFTVKNEVKGSMMTGSGSAFFVLRDKINSEINPEKYIIIENLKTISDGVEII